MQSEEDESDAESLVNSSDGSDVVFQRDEKAFLSIDSTETEHLTSTGDDIAGGSVKSFDDLSSNSDVHSDYPSNRSDIQSSIKEDNIMEELEKEHNVPLFLSLNCTLRDKTHLSSTMVNMPTEDLPVCFGKFIVYHSIVWRYIRITM